MRTSTFVLGALGLGAACFACTQSYGDYDFGGAPASAGATGTAAAGGAGGATGGAGAAGGSAGGEGGSGGSGGVVGTGGGGSGGMPTSGEVACGAAPCSISGGGFCCIPKTGPPTCEPSGGVCTGNKVAAHCDGPEDCGGQLCCGDVVMGDLTALQCAATCTAFDEAIICDPAAPQCEAPETCQESTQLGPAYHVCK